MLNSNLLDVLTTRYRVKPIGPCFKSLNTLAHSRFSILHPPLYVLLTTSSFAHAQFAIMCTFRCALDNLSVRRMLSSQIRIRVLFPHSPLRKAVSGTLAAERATLVTSPQPIFSNFMIFTNNRQHFQTFQAL